MKALGASADGPKLRQAQASGTHVPRRPGPVAFSAYEISEPVSCQGPRRVPPLGSSMTANRHQPLGYPRCPRQSVLALPAAAETRRAGMASSASHPNATTEWSSKPVCAIMTGA